MVAQHGQITDIKAHRDVNSKCDIRHHAYKHNEAKIWAKGASKVHHCNSCRNVSVTVTKATHQYPPRWAGLKTAPS